MEVVAKLDYVLTSILRKTSSCQSKYVLNTPVNLGRSGLCEKLQGVPINMGISRHLHTKSNKYLQRPFENHDSTPVSIWI